MNRLADWVAVLIAALALSGAMIGAWTVLKGEASANAAKYAELERRVTANENYDGQLQTDIDIMRERVVKNETHIEHISGNLDDIALALKDIAKDTKTTNETLNKFMIEQAKEGK